MAPRVWLASLLAYFAMAVVMSDSSEEEAEAEARTLPFMVKKYEGTFQPASDGGDARVTLTVHYVTNGATFELNWAASYHDVGISFPDLSGARAVSHCVESANGDQYICTATVQTSMMRVLRRLGAELLYASNSTVVRYYGFSSLVKNFRGITEPTHRVQLAAPLDAYAYPPRQTHFTPGDDVTLRWEMASDNRRELALIRRKTGALFEEEELYSQGDDEEYSERRLVTTSNVQIQITITKATENTYNYVIVLTISAATSEDTGVYIIETSEGMQNWVEVMEDVVDSAYPQSPVLHMDRHVGSSHFAILCAAEGHDLTDISLQFNDVVLTSSADEQVTRSCRTSDACAVAYRVEPNAQRSIAEYSGAYICTVTQASGTQAAMRQVYTFEEPDV